MGTSIKPVVGVALSGTLALLMWFYYAHYQNLIETRLTGQGFPERNFSDLYPSWLGSRELLLHHRDPYSPDITRQIQRGYYGRPIDHRLPNDPVDEQRFAYPLFVAFFLAPTISLPFGIVKVLATLILLSLAIWTTLLWCVDLGFHLGREQALALVLLTLATIPYVEGIFLQQLSVLVGFLIAAASRALAQNRLVCAGLLLGAATVKPQLSLPFVSYVLLWALCKWPLRRRLVFAFGLTMAGLVVGSMLYLPRWPLKFILGIGPYLQYTHATSGIRALFGSAIGPVVDIIFCAMTVVVAWRARSKPADSIEFLFAGVVVLAFTCQVIPSLAPHNEVLLLPAYLVLAREHKRLLAIGPLTRSIFYAAVLVIAWPLATGTLLAVARFVSADPRLSQAWDVPLATNPLIPIVAFIAVTSVSAQLIYSDLRPASVIHS